MRAVFEAVAHRNPFPRERFDENRWNQVVLKALFIGSTLHPIQGLDERANPALAAILIDYAHERWAAGRRFRRSSGAASGPSPWPRCSPDLERALSGEDETERRAAALALAASPAAEARALLAGADEIAAEIESGALTWERLAQA